MDARESGNVKGSGRIPPYVSFRTLKTFMQDLHDHDIPQTIDRHVLQKLSGTVRNQLMTALRFLELIDGDDRPTDDLRALSGAFQSTEWSQALAGMLRAQYAPIFSEVDLATTTPPQVHKAFRNAYGGNDAVLKKSEAFFLQAAKEAEIPISKRISVVSRAPSAMPRKRNESSRAETEDVENTETPASPKPKQAKAGRTHEANGDNTNKASPPKQSVYDVLLSIWQPGRMPPEVDEAIVTVMRWLKQQEVEAANQPPS